MSFGYQVLGFGAFPSRGVDSFAPSHAAVFDGSTDYLTFKFNEAGNTAKFTLSVWTKRSDPANTDIIFEARADGNNTGTLYFNTTDIHWQDYDDGVGTPAWRLNSDAMFRDPTAWMNIVIICDTAQSVQANRQRIFVNGVQLTSFSTNTLSSQYYASAQGILSTNPHYLGFDGNTSGTNYYDGYMAEFILLDGIAAEPTTFGEYDSSTGIWVAKDPLQGYTGGLAGTPNIADWGGANSLYFNFSDTNDLGKNFRPTEVTANPGTYKIDYSIYFDGSSQYLDQASAFSSAPTDADKYTLSMWLKRVEPGTAGTFAHSNPSAAEYEQIKFNPDDIEYQYNFNDGGGDFGFNVVTTALYRDPTAWMHLIFRRNAGVVDIFVNGVKEASTNATQAGNTDTKHGHFNDTAGVVEFGRRNYPGGSAAEYYHGYMAEVIFLDGYFAEPTDLGGWDANGIWMPVDPTTLLSSSKGTNGFALQFKGDGSTFDSNADAGGVGADTSTNNHHFRGQGNVHLNRTTDTPTNTSGDNEGNYCTWNPQKPTSGTFSNGNLTVQPSADKMAIGTIAFDYNDSDGYYMEIVTGVGGLGYVGIIHIDQASVFSDTFTPGSEYRYQFYSTSNAQQVNDGGGSETEYNTGSTFGAGDVVQIAVKGSDIWFGVNNTWVNNSSGSAGNPSTGANPVFTNMGANSTASVVPYCQALGSSYTTSFTLNCGQKGFSYTPPTGFKALNTASVAALTYTDARKYFAPVIYEGTGSTRNVRGCYDSSGTAWAPDWVWIKNREQTDDHRLFDTLRGPFHYLETNSTNNESQGNLLGNMLSEFTSGGFKIGDNVSVNTANESYVAWCWRAGGRPTVENTATSSAMDDGSVFKGGTVQSSYTPSGTPSIYPTKMSIAEHGGFSIINWTGDGTNSDTTIPHGLDAAVEFVITKNRDLGTDWLVKHKDDGVSDGTNFRLNLSSSTTPAASGYLKAAGLTTHTFEFDEGDSNANNFRNNGERYLAYCFTRVPGLIGIGKYTGGGSNAEPYIVVDDGASGFRPAWVMLKNVSASQDWEIHDIAREPFNIAGGGTFAGRLQPSTTSGDSTTFVLQKTSNGFKIVTTGASTNGDGNTLIYLAFADQPFQLQARAL